MRYGFCCDPVGDEYLASGKPCTGPCVSYHKADFPNLARRLGLKYVEYWNATYISMNTGGNPIERRYIYVNRDALADTIARSVHEA